MDILRLRFLKILVSLKSKRIMEVGIACFEHALKKYCYFCSNYLTLSNCKHGHFSVILILGSSSATSSTAVGFDERMLLHSEV